MPNQNASLLHHLWAFDGSHLLSIADPQEVWDGYYQMMLMRLEEYYSLRAVTVTSREPALRFNTFLSEIAGWCGQIECRIGIGDSSVDGQSHSQVKEQRSLRTRLSSKAQSTSGTKWTTWPEEQLKIHTNQHLLRRNLNRSGLHCPPKETNSATQCPSHFW